MSTPIEPLAPRDGLAGSDEAVEAAAKAEYEHCRDVEETEWERGRWERLEPAHRERYLRAAHRAVTAAAPFIAARVRAEAVVEHRADLQHRIEVSTRYENDRRVALAERDEYHRNWQEAEKRTGEAVAEAVAEERQRIRTELHELAQLLPVEEAQRASSWLARAFGTSQLAAGSVPVATPAEPDCACPFHWPGGHGAMPWATGPDSAAEVARYRAAIEHVRKAIQQPRVSADDWGQWLLHAEVVPYPAQRRLLGVLAAALGGGAE